MEPLLLKSYVPSVSCEDAAAALLSRVTSLSIASPHRRVRVSVEDSPSARGVFSGSLGAGSAHVDAALSLVSAWLHGARTPSLAGAYLAQTSLFSATPSPAELPECADVVDALVSASTAATLLAASGARSMPTHLQTVLWANGVERVVSAAHYDQVHGVLVVLRGQKRAVVFAPSAGVALGALPAGSPTPNHGGWACALSHEDDAPPPPPPPHAPSLDVELSAGDALVIPEGYWHSIASAPHTIAVTFWFSGSRELAAHELGDAGALYLARASFGALVRSHVARVRAESVAGAAARVRMRGRGEPPREPEPLSAAVMRELNPPSRSRSRSRSPHGVSGRVAEEGGAARACDLLVAVASDGALTRRALERVLHAGRADDLARVFCALSHHALDALSAGWEDDEGDDGDGVGMDGIWRGAFKSDADALAAATRALVDASKCVAEEAQRAALREMGLSVSIY